MMATTTDVRVAIDTIMRKFGLYEKARAVLRAQALEAAKNGLDKPTPPTDIFGALRSAGLLDDLLLAIRDPSSGLNIDEDLLESLIGGSKQKSEENKAQTEAPKSESAPVKTVAEDAPISDEKNVEASDLDPTRRYLEIRPGRGRAFLTHLDESYLVFDDDEVDTLGSLTVAADSTSSVSGSGGSSVKRYYCVSILCRNQRMRSAIIPATSSPDFGKNSSSLFVDIEPSPEPTNGTPTSLRDILTYYSKEAVQGPSSDQEHIVHIVLTMSTHILRPFVTGAMTSYLPEVSTETIGVYSLDWRSVLGAEDLKTEILVPIQPVCPGPANTAIGTATDGMNGSAAPSIVSVGLLPLTLRLTPSRKASGAALSGGPPDLRGDIQPSIEEVNRSIQKSSSIVAADHQSVLSYASKWWAAAKQRFPHLKKKQNLSIFAEAENGAFLLFPCFLVPLRADRVIDSPADAARMVTLLPAQKTQQNSNLVSGRRNIWPSPHSILTTHSTTAEGRALLLCSLLLGFGLDAYVAVGSRAQLEAAEAVTQSELGVSPFEGTGRVLVSTSEEAYLWVVTRYPGTSSSGPLVHFWDPATGLKSSPGDVCPLGSGFNGHFSYTRISAVFSDRSFYVCSAPDDSIAALDWSFDTGASEHSNTGPLHFENSNWICLDGSIINWVGKVLPIPIAPSALDAPSLAVSIEAALRQSIENFRRQPSIEAKMLTIRGGNKVAEQLAFVEGRGLVDVSLTLWDSKLSYIMQQAVSNFEAERKYGPQFSIAYSPSNSQSLRSITIAQQEFAAAVKRTVPRNHTFRGFPIMFNHLSPTRMLDTLVAVPLAREIIETPADRSVAFSLRVSVYPYAEDTVAVWVMIGVRQQLTV